MNVCDGVSVLNVDVCVTVLPEVPAALAFALAVTV